MKKILFAVVVGAVLGAFDGLTAWFEPSVRPQIGTIVMLSSLKSVIVGFLVGGLACFVKNRRVIMTSGLVLGLAFAYFVASQPDPNTGEHYYLQIMIPGMIVGLLVGYATAKYAEKQQVTQART